MEDRAISEDKLVILGFFALAGAMWAVVGMFVLILWPVARVPSPELGENLRLVLFFPGTFAALLMTWLAQAGLPIGDPILFPATVGTFIGLLAGSAVIRRT